MDEENGIYRRYSDDDDEEEPLIEEELTTEIKKPANMKNRMVFFVIICLCTILYIVQYNHIRDNRREIVGWSLNTSRDPIDYILPHENTTLIEPTNLCKDKKPLFMLIVVCSSARNFEARQTIRETWGNTTEFNYPYFQKFHSQYNASYLNINSKTWRNYVSEQADRHKIISNNPKTSSSQNSASNNVNLNNFKMKVVFMLGTINDVSMEQQYQVNYESEVYGDIIQENFLDSYNNLTLKSILMLKYVKNNCENKVKYVMKCDDDTFINVPNLIHVLLGGTIPIYKSTIFYNDKTTINAKSSKARLVENSKYLLLGFKFCNARPISDVTSKWYAPNYMYNGEFYPNYLSGTAYLMSEAAVRKLYEASLSTPLFHLEDVYVTGFVADKIKIRRTHHPLFFYLSNKDHCALRGMISQHQLTPMAIEAAYNFITNSTIECAVPGKNFITTKLKLTQRKRCL